MQTQFINTNEWGIKKGRLKQSIDRLKKHVPEVDGVLNVVFVDDKFIQNLNKEHRGKDTPTDVLSFSYLDEPLEGVVGEIYISVPTAKKQADEAKWSLEDELNKLFVHGFLHVYGHDHESEKDFEAMNKIENEVLNN